MGLREVVMTNFRRSPLSERIFRFPAVLFACQRTLQATTGGLWRVSAGLPGILRLWRPAEQVSSILFYRGRKRKRIQAKLSFKSAMHPHTRKRPHSQTGKVRAPRVPRTVASMCNCLGLIKHPSNRQSLKSRATF